MGFEGSGGNGNLVGMRVTPIQIHKRSKSFPDKKTLEEDEVVCSIKMSNRVKLGEGYLKDYPNMEPQNSLKQEILQLEKRLQDQFEVRRALEKASGYRFSPADETTEVTTAKPAAELIREISVLELEVVHLEQYLLSLYRKAFDGELLCKSPSSPRGRRLEVHRPDVLSKGGKLEVRPGFKAQENLWKETKEIGEEKPLDSSVHRCHSSLSHCSGSSTRFSPPAEGVAKSFHSYHSEPLSMMEYPQNGSCNIISLAEHLGTCISDHILETPNRLSEDMVKCMASIYCKLAHPPLPNHGLSSPNSSLSSTGGFSPQDQCDMWSPRLKNYSSFDARLDNPFHVEGLKEFSGPYSTMVEVTSIYRDNKKLGDIGILLHNFRSLVSKLEEVDPRKLNREEKLAFWINIHNSLAMHAYLAYGIPQNNLKHVFLLSKAAYNVGGHTISADKMQSSILGFRTSLPGQWLRLLLSSTKFKIGDERQAYTIDRPEPLLHFALCTGSHSDPAVRVYTPKRIFQELEAAKEEYFRATFGIRKDRKIVLPKLVESYGKESDLCADGLIEMIQKSLPESVRKRLKVNQHGKSRKNIEWVPHNFTFRFLISKELVR